MCRSASASSITAGACQWFLRWELAAAIIIPGWIVALRSGIMLCMVAFSEADSNVFSPLFMLFQSGIEVYSRLLNS